MAREPSTGPVKRGGCTCRYGKQEKEIGKVIKYCKDFLYYFFFILDLHKALWLLLRIRCRNYPSDQIFSLDVLIYTRC